MPEYFEISFLSKKITENQKDKLLSSFLKNLHLQEGENYLIKSNLSLLQNKDILFHAYEYDDNDYIECTISLPNLVFYKQSFTKMIDEIKSIVQKCFEFYPFDFAVCSYEMNSYFITNVKTIKDMNDVFLNKFPLYFMGNDQKLNVHIQLKAQDIFR